jgi:TorA maturation chaperone TorD
MRSESLASQGTGNAPEAVVTTVSEEDLLRAGTYALLGALLAGPPGDDLLARLGEVEEDPGDSGEMAACWQLLKQASGQTAAAQADDEYHDLFIGLGRGEVVPYASWYLTGFLMERPLALLRRDLARYGIERQEGVSEPEDHAAALCEAMAVVIQDGDTAAQKALFHDHLAPWMQRFFRDLQDARTARFYRAVGRLGEQFMQFERQYLDLPARPADGDHE